jgi:hypothetical protein
MRKSAVLRVWGRIVGYTETIQARAHCKLTSALPVTHSYPFHASVLHGYEAMHLIRQGQIRWLPKGDVVGQRQFIHTLFGIAA